MAPFQENKAGEEKWGEKQAYVHAEESNAEESKKQMKLTRKGKPQSKRRQNGLMELERL